MLWWEWGKKKFFNFGVDGDTRELGWYEEISWTIDKFEDKKWNWSGTVECNLLAFKNQWWW